MLFFNTYVILTFFMILNKVYCLVHHQRDYRMKNLVIVIRGINNEQFKKMQSKVLANFYGGPFLALFVIVVEIAWLIVGLFSFMWPYFLGLFVFNYIINTIDEKMYVSSVTFFLIKLLYFFVYLGLAFIFLNHYFHFVDF